MHELRGQAVSGGIALGQCTILTASEIKVRAEKIAPDRVEAELRRFRRAVRLTRRDIDALRRSQSDQPDVERIIGTTIAYLDDEVVTADIERMITEEGWSAAYAVSTVLTGLAENLQRLDNPTFSTKVGEMLDLEHRILDHLLGGRLARVQKLSRQLIVVADDLTPAQAATLDRDKVLGFATERGSWASHTAILSRALGIPAVVGVPNLTKLVTLGATVIIDGNQGVVIVDPDRPTLLEYRQQRRREKRRVQSALQSSRLPSRTRDGEECELSGNVETKDDIPRVIEYGGTGVGLFRTEFLFLGRDTAPDEDEQYAQYREAVERMQGGAVVIRSMDFGGDKFDKRAGTTVESNPFMGFRAIRLSLEREDLFVTQLRAILRAAVHGDVRRMFPMIMDVDEFRRARAVVERARRDLERDGVEHAAHVPLGAMIELPSAAQTIDRLVEECDFFSIGTNDLTQYTLAVDRTNHRVAHLFAAHHPAVLALMARAVRACKRAGKPISACGEMAGDPLYVPLLLGIGLRSLSAAPPLIPAVKRRIRSVYLSRCIDAAEKALEAGCAREVEEIIRALD